MAHDIWVPLSFVAMLTQANLCQSGPLSKEECDLRLALTFISDVLDNVMTFKGNDWDIFPLHLEDDPGDDDIKPEETEEAVKGPSIVARVNEDCNHVTSWDSDSNKYHPDKDLNSHHSSMCGSP